MTLKFFSTVEKLGIVLALRNSVMTEPPWLGRGAALSGPKPEL
jgi:hypothetical protein